MRYYSVSASVLPLAVCLFLTHVLGQLPPLLPTNEKELKTTLDDISYSVDKITSPDFKVSRTLWQRLLKSLEAPSTPQPANVQGNDTLVNVLGNIGRFVLSIVRWSIDLAKAIKGNKLTIGVNNVTANGNPTSASVNEDNRSSLTLNTNPVTLSSQKPSR
ncbi:hypothetical protein BIW11_08918 [Tropilaelaps mercedesae]|uniref:Uncharacterized protein n=1 Tax=Tropilaelaps mercedesae TaxID=418985 RepID=A0A1V9XMS9_9ACAR|nr:hypothetical protein BIW11_08918 [Tropilaelaps mercedesae]